MGPGYPGAGTLTETHPTQMKMEILNGKYHLRPFCPGDEQGILKLWQTAFKADMAEKFFRWKYLENPYPEAMMLCVAQNGEIVTFYGGIPFEFQYKNRTASAVHLMDIMSHPGHRDNRVFEKTARQFMNYFCTSENLLLMYGFPGKVHYAIGERILNYEKISSVSYFQADAVGLICQNSFSKEKSPGLARVTDINNNAWPFDMVWETCSKFYPFTVKRDSGFVKWRYFNHPEKQYHVLRFFNADNGSDLAWAVLLLKGEKAVLVDMVVPTLLNLFRQIIIHIGRYLSDLGIEVIETWLPDNHFLAAYASACRFEKQNEPIGIIPTVSLFDHSPSQEWIKASLYYNMGDGDLF